MRRPTYALAATLLASTSLAQTAVTKRPEPTAQLPVTRVALYKNGVGFFEHAGHVTGNESVTIDFTSAQLNDVLQSLTAIDLGGGRIAGAGYNSTTPLEQQLKSLPLALGEDATDVDFYNAIRGARVEVHAPGAAITGRLLSIDLRTTPQKDGEPTVERRFVTVISESGQVRTLELTSTTEVHLLDTTLHTDLNRYLELLASTRNAGLRHLTLEDRGTGTRDLRVSYISEVPIWKSTYRILFTDSSKVNPTATLQGWSVVDNTTGEDWTNVQLSLIAGAPQSFIQPLSIPYYSRRPEIPLPQEAQLSPQTHDSGEMNESAQMQAQGGPQPLAAIKVPRKVTLGSGSGNGIGPGSGGNMGGGVYGYGSGVTEQITVDGAPLDYAEAAEASIAPRTTTNAFDDFFEYKIADPITIRKNESALVPILQIKLPVERVTLWSSSEPTPLRALWITNSSDLTLDRGSFSIVENGNFGGEGLLDPIHPAEKRLLSYAADQAVHVSTQQAPQAHHLRSIVLAKGVLIEHYRDFIEHDYTIRNAAADARTVVIEHARTGDFNLHAESKDPLATDERKPDETTPKAYRFRVPVDAGKTAHLKVIETHAYPRQIQINTIDDQQVKVLALETGNNPDLLKQLQPLLDLQHHISDLRRSKQAVDTQLNSLNNEEKRQRDNITALKDTDKSAQKRFVDQLGQIEDTILEQQKQQETLAAQINAAQQELSDKAQTLQFDQTMEP